MPNVTNITQIRGLTDTFSFLNNQEPFFGISIIIMIAVVSFMVVKANFEAKRAFAASSFLTTVTAAWLRSLGFISTPVLVIPIVLLILSMFWLYADRQE